MKKTYRIEVDCANCANKMELAAAKTPGVKSAVVMPPSVSDERWEKIHSI